MTEQNGKIIPAKVIHVSNLVMKGINFALLPHFDLSSTLNELINELILFANHL